MSSRCGRAGPPASLSSFVERFEMDATTFVNSLEGRHYCLRGIDTWIIQAGTIRVGDRIRKV